MKLWQQGYIGNSVLAMCACSALANAIVLPSTWKHECFGLGSKYSKRYLSQHSNVSADTYITMSGA